MATSFRVVDVRTNVIDANEILVDGVTTPEAAAERALGQRLARNGTRKNLVARVYWQQSGQPVSMVRLYSRSEDRPPAT